MTIVDFDTEVRIATYTQNDFTRLVARLRGRKPDGWTALWDAVGIYLGGSQDQTGQKVLIVFTDGGDTRSTLTYVDLLNALKASDVSVYAIGFLEHQPASVRTQQRLQLAQLADLTGGQAFFPVSMKEVESMYDRIVAEIDSRYLLGYVSSRSAHRRRLALGRSPADAAGSAAGAGSGPARATSRPTSRRPSRQP